MTLAHLVDNDVIIKICAYGFGSQLVALATEKAVPPAMLGVGRFVVRRQLEGGARFADGEKAQASFDTLLQTIQLVEPTDEELAIAADLEAVAVSANLELDTGESQLLALLIGRASGVLLTGDKRAIRAVAQMAIADAAGRIACFEQLMGAIAIAIGADSLRIAVCAEPKADKAMAICCSCASGQTPLIEDLLDALRSYIRDIRSVAGVVLLEGDDLFALAA